MLVFAAILLGCTAAARAERRVALIIGNSAYQYAPVLANPAADARAMAAAFEKAGFDVVAAQYNVGNLQLKREIRQFEEEAAKADVAVVYFAGYGINISGVNYLIPVDAKLQNDRDVAGEATSLDTLLKSIDRAKLLRLIILDACRNNPFPAKTGSSNTNSGDHATVDPGPGSTLVAFAAKAGSEALDGSTGHSPYTLALLDNLFVPGRSVQAAFSYVRDDVLKRTHNQQEPYVYGSLGAQAAALVPATEQTQVAAERDFDTIDTITRGVSPAMAVNAWKVFLAEHPSGPFADLARKKIADVQLASLGPPANISPRLSEDERSWEAIKESSNPTDLQSFIARFPASPQAVIARDRLTKIEVAQAEARQALENAKRRADEAAKQRTEREAALKRAQEAGLEPVQEAPNAMARARQAAEAAAEARAVAEAEAAAARQRREVACETELDRLIALQAAGRVARGDLEKLGQGLTCERLRPLVAAALASANAHPDVNVSDQARLAPKEQEKPAKEQEDKVGSGRKAPAASVGSAPSALPEFPWPPPTASASYVIPQSLFGKRTTVGEETDAIIAALESNGYVERSFYSTPKSGVALITRLERINDDGSSATADERWPSQEFTRDSASLVDFLKGLFYADPGRYRVIVFIIRDRPFAQSITKTMSGKQAEKLLPGGDNVLPADVAARPAANSHCTALIYEFANDGSAMRRVDSRLTGRQHLEKAGFLAALQRPN